MQVLAAAVLLLSGCAKVAQQAGMSEPTAPVSGKGQMLPGSEVRASGFLRDYSQMKAVQGKPGEWEYVKQGVDWHPYDKIMVRPMEVWVNPGAEYPAIQVDIYRKIEATIREIVTQQFQSGGYQIVTQPGPGVLMFHYALTGVTPVPQELSLAQTRAAVYNSLVNLYKATGGGWVQIAERTADNPTPASPQLQKTSAQEKASAPAQDRIEVRQDGDVSIVDVYRVKGIGGAQVKAPASGWPPAVVVRLHDFPALESFKATSKAAAMDCALTRPEGQPAANRCTLGGAVVDAVRKDAGYYEVTLPEELLTADGGAVELRWVDQWR